LLETLSKDDYYLMISAYLPKGIEGNLEGMGLETHVWLERWKH